MYGVARDETVPLHAFGNRADSRITNQDLAWPRQERRLGAVVYKDDGAHGYAQKMC
jgi:hypothetical protein